ncbi:MAG: MBL fold metallo-hydrolase [Ignavibacteriales bacterium]|jgi:metallo-beta-lactamase family protein|nr:MBL fold metallo-hydrolase [Ignavibacteriales bacterium]MBK7266628.1 MBL fold metallo-hydrolase [Ignavibacteriales bacterium]MBK8660362.1 MBL fold metallo-hydrolase [Ignavibacteriales bacterium]MCC6637896.1 MBL fold metallo-hydrolase [Ignavibacteriaceae bacterium]
MNIQFIGAAETVTGSNHLLTTGSGTILLDCGMFQGKRKEAFELNRTFDFYNPKDIDAVILSHAHIDHAGNLPNLVKRGFRGTIFCTHATKDLCEIMLADSAHIQQKDTEFVNKKRAKQGKNLFEPLYTQQDVDETLNLMQGVNYHHEFEVLPGVTASFYDAGHILGSAVTYMKIEDDGKTIELGFSGDLGRPNMPILRDPEIIPDVDYFICESTYGGRFHEDFDMSEAKVVEVINRAIERKGKIIVPAFSLGRTQELVYLLHTIFEKGVVPLIPVYVDSPLSFNATAVFRRHTECYDLETSAHILRNEDPLGFNKLTYITDVEESKRLNDREGPMMIISASGMAESGRILHHLANNIQNPKNIIMMTGYCAEHTLGKRIIERNPEINIFGDPYQLKAEVVVFNSLSAHADSDELIYYVNKFNREKMKDIFLVHGEPDQQEKFKNRLLLNHFKSVKIPKRGELFSIK